MAERWQQWMPFHIDRFRGSPEVQAMHPAARWGYMSLLASQWQTEDCTLSPDPLDLASASGLGDELWVLYGPRILRKFPPVDIGSRLRNEVCYMEWLDAKRVFDARSAAAKRTTEIRSPRQKATVTVPKGNGDRTPTDTLTLRPADTQTLTGTVTTTEEQKPSRAKKLREGPTKTDIAKTRHAEFKAAIGEYWVSRNTIEMPWGPAEGRNLEMWLRQTPNTTLEQFKALLRNRFRSEVNHSERPSRWIGNVTGFATGPLDKFGRPKASAISAPTIRYSDPEAMNAR